MRHRVYKKEHNDRISKNADILAVRWQLAADVFFCWIGNPFLSDKQVYCFFYWLRSFFSFILRTTPPSRKMGGVFIQVRPVSARSLG